MAPTNGLKPSGGKLYWRFFTIGARYCTHSFADCSAPSRDAAWTAWNLFYFTLGLVQEEQQPPTALHERAHSAMSNHEFPALNAVLEHFTSLDYDARFIFGIQQLLRPSISGPT